MNWKAPRYVPPPPIARGSPPDSHSLVRRAQRLLRREVFCHQVAYLPELALVVSGSSPVPIPPSEPSADATPANIATTAMTTAQKAKRSGRGVGRSRRVYSVGAGSGVKISCIWLLDACGVSCRARTGNWRYAADAMRFAPGPRSIWVPHSPRYVAGTQRKSAAD